MDDSDGQLHTHSGSAPGDAATQAAIRARNEAYVRAHAGLGLVADFTASDGWSADAKPVISAAFIRALMLGLDQPAGQDAPTRVLMPGVRITGARVEGVLDFADCTGQGGDGLPALVLDECDLPDPVWLAHASIARVSMRHARIRVIRARGLLTGAVDLTGVTPHPAPTTEETTAWVDLTAARVDRDVRTRGATLIATDTAEPGYPAPNALTAQGAQIRGNLLMDKGFSAHGAVWLLNVRVGGALSCAGARFLNAGGEAIQGEGAQIEGGLFLCAIGDQRFEAEGEISLLGARVGGDLELHGARLDAGPGRALVLSASWVGGRLLAEKNTITGVISLDGARVERLEDDVATAWADAALALNEFTVGHVSGFSGASTPWKTRAEWLRRNTKARGSGVRPDFNPQPWREIAAAMARAGRFSDARRIRRAMEDEAARAAGGLRGLGGLGMSVLFGHALSARRVLVAALAFWMIGWAGVNAALTAEVLAPADVNETLPCADALITPPVYALDLMIPLLDLGQVTVCRVAPPSPAAGARRDAFARGLSIATPPVPEAMPLIGGKQWRGQVFGELALWRWAKALYSVLGALVVFLTILTITRVLRTSSED